MKRVLEPELMEDKEQVKAYAEGNFSSNKLFVDFVCDEFSEYLNDIIDLGCGPADLCIRLLKLNKDSKIVAVDGSNEMLNYAKNMIVESDFLDRVDLIHEKIPLDINNKFDLIISKDLLHHLPDPMVFWNEVKKLAKGKTAVVVMDLFRFDSVEEVDLLVKEIAVDYPEVLRNDLYNSLLAAFTVEEVKEQLRNANLDLRCN